MKKIILIFFLLIIPACSTNHDPYADYNFTYTISIYQEELNYQNLTSYFAKGDAILIKARTQDLDPLDSVYYYKQALKYANTEEKAILYETIASISNNNLYYLKSFLIWKSLDNDFRANIDWNLFFGKDPDYEFQEYELKHPYFATPEDVSNITLGRSYFKLTSSDIIITQVDRVNRDWLSSQLDDPYSDNLLTIFSEGYDVNNIGWHEGGRLKQYNLPHKTATGTIVRKINNTWYAPNEQGIFMFEVPIDKVEYPTTRFLNENLALIIDTHGVNMLVEQAVRNNATVVLACCDSPSKVKAALYLNEKGIKVICNTDKYLSLILGQTNLTLGSSPFIIENDIVILGNQSINFNINDEIIVENATEFYGLSYYSTPTLYFSNLQEQTLLPFNLNFVTINDFNQTYLLTEIARKDKVHIIAARVYNEDDYTILKKWLQESPDNKLILFHTIPYPYGYLILKEFPQQTTFGDLMPIFL